MHITIGPVWSRLHDRSDVLFANTILYFNSYVYRKDKSDFQKKVRVDFVKRLVDLEGNFLTGFVPRLAKEARKFNRSVTFDVTYNTKNPIPPNINMQLFDHQKDIFDVAKKKRGIVVSPTGSGKTVMQIALASCFPNTKILVIVPGVDLLGQISKRFQEHFPSVGKVGAGILETDKQITVGIIDSIYTNLGNPLLELEQTELILVDEVHHGTAKLDSRLCKIMQNIPSPLRFGFTATFPPNEAEMHRAALEGNFGPIIKEVNVEQLIEKENLAKPRLIIKKIPENFKVKELKRYKDVYNEGIVRNKKRNAAIVEETMELVLAGKTILIITRMLEHADILNEMFEEIMDPAELASARGSTEDDQRDSILEKLRNKNIKVAISTLIWSKGVDIPSLDAVINAAGSKSELLNLQIIGRGARTTETKKEFIVVDFFDPSHRYLIEHFGYRVASYFERGWL
jgi:superfamily II DNA or RNA helicase